MSTAKDINISEKFVLSRIDVLNIFMVCETRWSQKYKRIAMVKRNLIAILEGLEKVSQEGNSATRNVAF